MRGEGGGAEISTAGFQADGWHKASVPTTVVAALVADGTYPDLFRNESEVASGDELLIEFFFANQDHAGRQSRSVAPGGFAPSSRLRPKRAREQTWLHFDGINLSRERLAEWREDRRRGGRCRHDAALRLRSANVSLQEKPMLWRWKFSRPIRSLAMTWVDWNPTPPDKDMGMWKDVYLTTSGDVALHHPFVGSKLDADYKSAALTITADVHNAAEPSDTGIVARRLRAYASARKLNWQPRSRRRLSSSPIGFRNCGLLIRGCGGRIRWARRNCIRRSCRLRLTDRVRIRHRCSLAFAK